jgi:hypothetical protein
MNPLALHIGNIPVCGVVLTGHLQGSFLGIKFCGTPHFLRVPTASRVSKNYN